MYIKARLYGPYCLRPRFSTVIITFLSAVVCWAILLWKCWGVNWREFVIEISENQLVFDLAATSNNSENIKRNDGPENDERRTLYFVRTPTSMVIAWQPVVFDILPVSTGGVLAGRTAFRGEVRHEHEVIVLEVTHVGGDVYRTSFTPSFDGEYKITVSLTFVNGEHLNYGSHVDARAVPVQGTPFVLAVESRAAPGKITMYCSQSTSGTARGRWVRCGSLRGIESCGRWQLDAVHDFDKLHGFFWLPYSCQLHHYTDHEIKTCLARNAWERIVFTGDSHSRYRAYHWATRLYGKCVDCGKTHVATQFEHVPKMEWVFDARGTRWPTTFQSIRRPTEIYINSKTRRSLFSDPLPVSTINGDLFLLNFGHWLLREVTLEKFMAEKLRAFVQAVKLRNSTVRAAGKPRFLWVNTMSLKWREDENVRNWTMTPSPSIIAYMNSFVDRAMQDSSLQVVDAFQVSNARLDAAHDATHYAKVFPNGKCAGAVENAVTNVMFNALCNVY